MLHAVQAARQSDFVLERARRNKTEKRFDRALEQYDAYLHAAPKDIEARVEFALLLADSDYAPAATAQLERVLRSEPERNDLRRRLVELDIQRKRYSDAQEHLRMLLGAFPADAGLWEQLGGCQDAAGYYGPAAESFLKAIEINPGQYESYVHLAEILRLRLSREREADGWMARLVETNSRSPQAHLAQARYLHQAAKKQERTALREAEAAIALVPTNADALLLAAELCGSLADEAAARRYAERAIAADPTLAGGYLALSRVEVRAKQPEKAVAALRRGLEKAAHGHQSGAIGHQSAAIGHQSAAMVGELLWDLGGIMIEQGRLDEARKTIQQLRDLPAEDAFYSLLTDYLSAQVEAAEGRWQFAASAFEDVARRWQRPPDEEESGPFERGNGPELFQDLQYRLAGCYERLDDRQAELAAFRKAAETDPLWVPARMGVAAALASLGRLNERWKSTGRSAAWREWPRPPISRAPGSWFARTCGFPRESAIGGKSKAFLHACGPRHACPADHAYMVPAWRHATLRSVLTCNRPIPSTWHCLRPKSFSARAGLRKARLCWPRSAISTPRKGKSGRRRRRLPLGGDNGTAPSTCSLKRNESSATASSCVSPAASTSWPATARRRAETSCSLATAWTAFPPRTA